MSNKTEQLIEAICTELGASATNLNQVGTYWIKEAHQAIRRAIESKLTEQGEEVLPLIEITGSANVRLLSGKVEIVKIDKPLPANDAEEFMNEYPYNPQKGIGANQVEIMEAYASQKVRELVEWMKTHRDGVYAEDIGTFLLQRDELIEKYDHLTKEQ